MNKENIKKWSNIRTTEDTSININLGDPDLSSQDNILGLTDSNNEFVLIAVWTMDSIDRNTPANEFAFIVQELNQKEVYIQDIQLGKPNNISCNLWELEESINTNQQLIAINNNTNEITYNAKGILHYLTKKHFNEIIFSYMGVCSTEYDFGLGYTTSNVYTPVIAGDLIVKIKVQDCFGNFAECTKVSKIYYNIEPCFTYTPLEVVKDTEITIIDCISGNLEQIIKVEYIVNGEVSNNILVLDKNTEIIQKITYFDGYKEVTKELTKDIILGNIPPEIDLDVIIPDSEDNPEYIFSHNGTDIDGYIEKVKWEIWRNNPDADGNDNWSLYYSTGKIEDLDDWIYNFSTIQGELKVQATVYDNMGASASQEYIINNECKTQVILCFENLDWNKKIKVIDFGLNIIKKEWITNIVKIPWIVDNIVIPWETKPIVTDFTPSIKKIEFKYKLTDIGRTGVL